mmetsp:Transcript_20951/g.32459  ORF Transcript_20951/g.32459 Transcript_20951/m.32459 type:complete len:192 (+) Transcript_20951:3222-3797(+)
MIQTQFDQLVETKRKEKNRSQSPMKTGRYMGDEDRRRDKSHDNSMGRHNDLIGMGAMGGNMSRAVAKVGPGRSKGVQRRNKMRENKDKNRSEELALAVSIILANLSCDEDFLKILLGVKKWKYIEYPSVDHHFQIPSSKAPAGGIIGKTDMEGKDEEDVQEDGNFRDLFQQKMFMQKSELKRASDPRELER